MNEKRGAPSGIALDVAVLRASVLPVLLVAGVLALVQVAQAKDLGVQGKAWDITEVDVRQLMVESAARVDWDAANEQAKESAEQYTQNLPRRSMPVAERTQTRWVDPSMTLASDIRVPVRDEKTGRWSWQVLYRKGQNVNPLATHRPLTAMLFFDARDRDQVTFVQQALVRNPYGLVPVEVSGENFKDLATLLGRPVFYANQPLVERFSIQHAPSVVYPGKAEHALHLGVTSFGRPFRTDELEQAWAPLVAAIREDTSRNGADNVPPR
jgi:conjugal transfer pilus assembly protein TraW